ncbi:MAG: hypothetical protein FJ098_12325, partial [Deltaproteobacteria bacterium]|nr:hypothetical protein [Deltaproteobacteria bacterium]
LLLHGFGGSRADFLALAEPFAAAGWVLLAADLPFHGARAPEGLESGAGFLSAHPASLRDNLVAAALDQVQVLRFASSPAGLASLLPGVTLDTGGVAVVGESLGGLVAAILAGIDPAVETLALAGAGGHLARILAETPDPALAATLQEALAARGLTAGTPEAARFLEEVQMLLDRGDPVNYAAEYGLREPPPRLLLVTAGDGTGDGTIPAGAALELACAARGDGQPWTFHVEGSCGGDPQGACHGFLLHPETAPAAAAAATEAILAFFAAGGLPDPDAGLSPADALDCPDGT